jgi:hypothetical protein
MVFLPVIFLNTMIRLTFILPIDRHERFKIHIVLLYDGEGFRIRYY